MDVGLDLGRADDGRLVGHNNWGLIGHNNRAYRRLVRLHIWEYRGLVGHNSRANRGLVRHYSWAYWRLIGHYSRAYYRGFVCLERGLVALELV